MSTATAFKARDEMLMRGDSDSDNTPVFTADHVERIQEQTRIATEHRIAILKKAALRAESLKPDKEKLLQVATWLANLEMPEVSADSFDLAQSVHAVIYRACGEIRSMLELAQ